MVKRSAPFALALACAALLGAGFALLPAARPALSQEERRAPATTLRDAWQEVEGRRAAVQRDGPLLIVAVSLRDQVGPMLVQSVGTDHVVLVADGSGPRWHSVVPFDMIELQVLR